MAFTIFACPYLYLSSTELKINTKMEPIESKALENDDINNLQIDSKKGTGKHSFLEKGRDHMV